MYSISSGHVTCVAWTGLLDLQGQRGSGPLETGSDAQHVVTYAVSKGKWLCLGSETAVKRALAGIPGCRRRWAPSSWISRLMSQDVGAWTPFTYSVPGGFRASKAFETMEKLKEHWRRSEEEQGKKRVKRRGTSHLRRSWCSWVRTALARPPLSACWRACWSPTTLKKAGFGSLDIAIIAIWSLISNHM